MQCESCKRFQSQLTNDEGNPVALGSDGNHQYQDYYCGERRQIPGTDGQCGPNNGRACASCVRLREAIEAVGASEPRIDTGFSFAPRPTLNDRAMRQRPLLPPYCLPVLSEPSPISQQSSDADAPEATAPTPLPRKDLQWTSAHPHIVVESGQLAVRAPDQSCPGGTRRGPALCSGRHAEPLQYLWTFGVEQPVGSLAAHKHALVPMQSSMNTCDIGGPGCRGSGTAFQCPQGCNFDVCSVCAASASKGELHMAVGVVLDSRKDDRDAPFYSAVLHATEGVYADGPTTTHLVRQYNQFNQKCDQLIELQLDLQASVLHARVVTEPSPRTAGGATDGGGARIISHKMLELPPLPPGDAWVLRADLTHNQALSFHRAGKAVGSTPRSREFIAKGGAMGQCPSGHDLKPGTARGGTCDTCSRNVRNGEYVTECKACNWYMCTNCCQVAPACVSWRAPPPSASLASKAASLPPLIERRALRLFDEKFQPLATAAAAADLGLDDVALYCPAAGATAAPRAADLIRWLEWAAEAGCAAGIVPGDADGALVAAYDSAAARLGANGFRCIALSSESVGELVWAAQMAAGVWGAALTRPPPRGANPPPARRLLDDLRARGKEWGLDDGEPARCLAACGGDPVRAIGALLSAAVSRVVESDVGFGVAPANATTLPWVVHTLVRALGARIGAAAAEVRAAPPPVGQVAALKAQLLRAVAAGEGEGAAWAGSAPPSALLALLLEFLHALPRAEVVAELEKTSRSHPWRTGKLDAAAPPDGGLSGFKLGGRTTPPPKPFGTGTVKDTPPKPSGGLFGQAAAAAAPNPFGGGASAFGGGFGAPSAFGAAPSHGFGRAAPNPFAAVTATAAAPPVPAPAGGGLFGSPSAAAAPSPAPAPAGASPNPFAGFGAAAAAPAAAAAAGSSPFTFTASNPASPTAAAAPALPAPSRSPRPIRRRPRHSPPRRPTTAPRARRRRRLRSRSFGRARRRARWCSILSLRSPRSRTSRRWRACASRAAAARSAAPARQRRRRLRLGRRARRRAPPSCCE